MDYNYPAQPAAWGFDAPSSAQPQASTSQAAAADWSSSLPAQMAPDASRDPLDTSQMFFHSLPSLSSTQFASGTFGYPSSSHAGFDSASPPISSPWYGSPPNGHHPTISPTRLQSQQQQPHPQTIDPAFVMQSNHHHYAPSIHPMLVQQAQPPQLGGISPAALHLSPPVGHSSPSAQPDIKPNLLQLLKPLLATRVLESQANAKAAVYNIVDVIDRQRATEVDLAVRKEIMSRIRDNAGPEFLAAWVKDEHAMQVVKNWLKAGLSGKDAGTDDSNDALIATLMVITRLPLTVDLLKATQIGKYIKHISNKPPSNGEYSSLTTASTYFAVSEKSLQSLVRTTAVSCHLIAIIVSNWTCFERNVCFDGVAAIKSVAQNLETAWREMISKQMEEESDDKQDGKQRKRKLSEVGASRDTPPAKKQAVTPSAIPANASSFKAAVAVKKESKAGAGVGAAVKDAKSDSSFFSAPKAKPKLPSFTKKSAVPTPTSAASSVKQENVAQPMSSLNPFADALKSIDKSRLGTPPASAAALSGPNNTTGSSTSLSDQPNKNKKRVTFAPEHQLRAIKYIERAVYDDDEDGAHVRHDLRDLDRGEGAAMHHHLFEEVVDWYEPQDLDFHGLTVLEERGGQSFEKVAQEERERRTLRADYATPDEIPITPAEAPHVVEEEPEPKIMLCGSELDALVNHIGQPPATVHDLLGQLASTSSTPSQSAQPTPMVIDTPSTAAATAVIPEGTSAILQQLLSQYASQSSPAGAPSEQPAIPNGSQTPSASDAWSHWSQQQDTTLQPQVNSNGTWSTFATQQREDERSSGYESRQNDRGRGRGRGGGGFRGGGGRRTPCRFYLQGTCKFGDRCDFLHER
ncbi:hypothetical protein BKA62DRAFT_826568 [Auriculariales sp. MPI-PUGE-AT-0066]|nr:hypothetical protein BKA62DRAFT_826568 [Auriculariales sp. MPI-PUGE-AT-0066]